MTPWRCCIPAGLYRRAGAVGYRPGIARLLALAIREDDTPLAREALALARAQGLLDEVLTLGTEGGVNFAPTVPSPLWYAVTYGRLEIVKLLFAEGAVPPHNPVVELPDDMDSLLFEAAQRGFTDVARLLIARGAPVDGLGTSSPLQEAAAFGQVTAIRTLIALGADPDRAVPSGRCALALAPSEEARTVLRELGADVNRTDRQGRLALVEATRAGNVAFVRKLLDLGADRARAAANGETALEVARVLDAREALALLRRQDGGPPPAEATPAPAGPGSSESEAALEKAAAQGDLSDLLGLGANPDLRDAGGVNARQVATTLQRKELSEILLP